ncbi:DUF4190 domain-containing protein [Promicromonospora sukumoe]|uniref:DUF4190 domain-containing protein n=1 Tax=Promicromonospora sukumoe TaxID=88382 RepID=UPI0003777EDD|nr:DUF4190 domain-containing protein [Promicromonospora sukumoe]
MTENEGGTPRDPQPETPPTQPLPGSTSPQVPEGSPTQPLPDQPYGSEQPPAPQQPGPHQPGQDPGSPRHPGPDPNAPYVQHGQHSAPTPYGQPGGPTTTPPQYGYSQTPPKNDLGVWALVTGILSYVFCPLLLGIAAIITGTMSRRAADEGLANNRGMGTAGLILGWINVALVVAAIIFFVIALAVGLFAGGINWDQMRDPNDWNY